ncbi:MAG TPA: xanthine dehydrogenase accessory protein XdhC [Caulobacteraceae bacterium]|nr:xanthine dehydrogenase accessory protein XdhC [Caulobacteraceae bacterium]
MRDWPRQALELLDAEGRGVMVSLLAVEGSTPREAGTKMLVGARGCRGTIGGGNLEHQAIDQARRMLAANAAARVAVQDYPLGPLLAQCCGGRVRLMLELIDSGDRGWLRDADHMQGEQAPFAVRARITEAGLVRTVLPASDDAHGRITLNGAAMSARGDKPSIGDELVEYAASPWPSVLMFGAGHVGSALARVLAPLPLRLLWADSRDDIGPAEGLRSLPPEALKALAWEGADFTLILTHDHALDYALVSAALAGKTGGYLGLIGSRTKRARFASRLRADGFSDLAIGRVVCPIGLPGLRDKAPEVIAVSVAADLMLRVHDQAGACVREPSLASL